MSKPVPSTEAPRRGRPRSAERLERVLVCATRQFLDQGFERTSMESVALEAGVSKVTLYAYFPSKEILFGAVVARLSDSAAGLMLVGDLDPHHPAQGLSRLGERFLQLVRNPSIVALQRVLFGFGGQRESLSRAFYEQGPLRIVTGVATYLQATHDAAALWVPEPERAADHFLSMLLGAANFRCMLGIDPPTAEEDARHLRACVDTLLAVLARPAHPPPRAAARPGLEAAR